MKPYDIADIRKISALEMAIKWFLLAHPEHANELNDLVEEFLEVANDTK